KGCRLTLPIGGGTARRFEADQARIEREWQLRETGSSTSPTFAVFGTTESPVSALECDGHGRSQTAQMATHRHADHHSRCGLWIWSVQVPLRAKNCNQSSVHADFQADGERHGCGGSHFA